MVFVHIKTIRLQLSFDSNESTQMLSVNTRFRLSTLLDYVAARSLTSSIFNPISPEQVNNFPQNVDDVLVVQFMF